MKDVKVEISSIAQLASPQLADDSPLSHVCRAIHSSSHPASIWQKGIVFIGPPGSGKGTQADMLKQKFEGKKVCHLSTGDMLRAAIQAGTELGKKVKPILESGGLVEDDTMVALIGDTINEDRCHDGFILDGFPRTVVQAEKVRFSLLLSSFLLSSLCADIFSKKSDPRLSRCSSTKCSPKMLTIER